jgi:hypothetical protein
MSKKFTPFFLMLLSATFSLHAQVSLGVRAGYTLSATQIKSSTGYKSNTIGTSSQLKNLHADLVINVPVYGMLYLQPMVRYLTKGAYLKPFSSQQGIYVESANRLKMHYLELPANVVLKIPISIGKIVLGGGPYIAYNLGGSYDLDLMYEGTVVQTDRHPIAFNRNDRGISPGIRIHRWDAGLNAAAGIEFRNLITVGMNLSKGLMNLDRSSSSRMTNSYFSVSLGILLDREDY